RLEAGTKNYSNTRSNGIELFSPPAHNREECAAVRSGGLLLSCVELYLTAHDPNRSRLRSMPQTPPAQSATTMDLSIGATDEDNRPLRVAGLKGTPEEIERQWYEQVYRGHGDSMAQLTWRAVLIGSCLGGVLSLTNLYIGLKAGWGFG